jgi:hypothetical protein
MREITRVCGVLAAMAAGTVLALAPPATAATATTTTLVSSANPSTAGQAVTLTSTVTGDAPTGQVVFDDSGVTLGSVDLTTGTATLVLSSLSVGDHALTATYAGDANNTGSVATLTQTVSAPPPPAPLPAPAPTPVTVKAPKVKLMVSTTKASVGDKVQLRWHSKHADSVMASGDWAGEQEAKGSASIRISDRGKHIFKLTVQNASGAKTATVKVLAARKAKALDLVVTDELTMVGTDVDVTADGLAKGEGYTIRLNGKPIMTGKANKKGDVARTFELAKTTPEGALALTITGSNPGRLGASILNVIRPKTLDVEVDVPELRRKETQTVTVTGLAPGETVTVMYAAAKLTVGKADEGGLFTYDFGVGKEPGDKTVKIIGADPSRHGEAAFTVLTAHGGGSHAPPGQPARVLAAGV